jgi:hypothetical protein
MVTDNRSAGPWQPVEYEGYEPLRIVDLKVHMLASRSLVSQRVSSVSSPMGASRVGAIR